MNTNLLVKLIGFPATIIHGDTLMLDRWKWLRDRLPGTRNGEALIDVGCGSGAYCIGATLRGYRALGLSWDERNQRVAAERAAMCGAKSAKFEVLDVRHLDERPDFAAAFDVAICFENIEHILDDRKLITDIAGCLKPGGRLLLTTPNFHYRPMTIGDDGPFDPIENGGHVRRGYTPVMLQELCDAADLKIDCVSYCSGFCSQKLTSILRRLSTLHPLVGWAAVLPFRLIPPALDPLFTFITRWPSYSICLEAYKQRFQNGGSAASAEGNRPKVLHYREP